MSLPANLQELDDQFSCLFDGAGFLAADRKVQPPGRNSDVQQSFDEL
jgi:hypothetical protein